MLLDIIDLQYLHAASGIDTYLYKVALDILRAEQISAIHMVLSLNIFFAILTFGLSIYMSFLPPTRPLALAADRPYQVIHPDTYEATFLV
jgi:hypothetical protein